MEQRKKDYLQDIKHVADHIYWRFLVLSILFF